MVNSGLHGKMKFYWKSNKCLSFFFVKLLWAAMGESNHYDNKQETKMNLLSFHLLNSIESFV